MTLTRTAPGKFRVESYGAAYTLHQSASGIGFWAEGPTGEYIGTFGGLDVAMAGVARYAREKYEKLTNPQDLMPALQLLGWTEV